MSLEFLNVLVFRLTVSYNYAKQSTKTLTGDFCLVLHETEMLQLCIAVRRNYKIKENKREGQKREGKR